MNVALLGQLRQVAFDRYLSLWLMPESARDFMLALFSLEQELLSLPGKVTNATLGVMRVTWWRDQLSLLANKPAPDHPVLQALQPYKDQAALLADYVETFDLPFYEEDRDRRLAERAGYMAALMHPYFPQLGLANLNLGLQSFYKGIKVVTGPRWLRFLSSAYRITSRGKLAWLALKHSFRPED